MDDMTSQRLALLKAALEQHQGQLEPILAAFVEPALALAQDRHGGGAFVRVIARAYAEKNDGLRQFLSDHYGHVLREFGKAIAECVPGLSKEELYWRLDFFSGALASSSVLPPPACAPTGPPKQPCNPRNYPMSNPLLVRKAAVLGEQFLGGAEDALLGRKMGGVTHEQDSVNQTLV